MAGDELRKRAEQALREQRLYAPAGDNAIEYYLALRRRTQKQDPLTENALMDLLPYTVIGAEQAIVRRDWDDAERLRLLIGAVDPAAPSLARLHDLIADGRRAEASRAEATVDVASALVAAPPVTPAPAALPPPRDATATPPPAPLPPPAPPKVAEAAASVGAAPLPDAATRHAVAAREPAPLRTPQPTYPSDARRFSLSGEVLANFTVQADGSVADIRTESVGASHPPLERTVEAALRRWKFEATGESHQMTRRFSFSP